MADVTVDSLQIEIEANSSKAAEQVNKLSAALERLKQGIGGSTLSSAAKQIKQLGETAQKSAPGQRKEAVSKAAKGVDALKATKELEKLDTQIAKTEDKISELKNRLNALVEIEASYPQGFGEREQNEIDKISQALSDLRTQYSALKQQRDETFGGIKQSVFPKIETPKAELDAANIKPLESAIDNARISVEVDDSSANAVDGLTERVRALHDAIKAVNAEKINLDIPKPAAQTEIEQVDIKKPDLEIADSGEVSQATEKINELKNELDNTTQAAQKATGESSRLKAALSDLGKSAVSSAASGLKKLGSYINSKFTAPFKNAIGVIDKVKSAFGRIMFYRAVRSAIQTVTNGLKEGINNLYQYSTIVGTQFAPAMNKLATASQYLKNSLGAMAAPLIQALAPAIDFIIDKFVLLLNVINKVFAALTGKSTYTVAKKQAKDYAEAANGAANATQKFLLGIDELNILNEDSGGGGAGADYGSMFEEMEIDSDTLDWAKQIRDAIENGDWRGAGSILAKKLNGLLESWDSYAWGYALGEKINNALNFVYGFMKTFNWGLLGSKLADGLNGIMDAIDWDLLGRVFASKWNALVDFIYGFVTTFHWADLGKNISDAVNAWFDEIDWAKAGLTIALGFNSIVLAIKTAIANIQWGEILADIQEFFANIFQNIDFFALMVAFLVPPLVSAVSKLIAAHPVLAIVVAGILALGPELGNSLTHMVSTIPWADIGKAFSDGAIFLLDRFNQAIESVNWFELGASIGKGLADVVTSIDWATLIGQLGLALVNVFFGAVEFLLGGLSGIFDGVADALFSIGQDSIAGLFKGISDALASVGSWLKEHIFDPIINGIKSLFGIHSPSTVMAEIGAFLIEGLLQGISDTWQGILDFFGNALDALTTSIGQAWDNIKEVASTAWENIKTVISTAWENIKQSTSEAWENIKTTLTTAWDNLKQSASEKFESIKQAISDAWENIRTATSEKWNSIKETLSSAWDTIKSTATAKFNEVKNSITNIWTGLVSSALTWGRDICSNIANGIKGAIGTVTSAVSSVASSIKSFLGFSEPEKGPLSNFHTYMPDMLQLMAKGIRDNTDLAVNAASDLAGEVKNAFSDMTYDVSDVNLPIIPDMEANYAVATSYSAANNAGASGGYSDAMQQSNEEMISAIYAVGQQIITAIQENGGDVYLDGSKVGSRVTQVQNRQNRMYGKTMQNV